MASGRAYLTGGSSAVLLNWRARTIDIDLELGRFERSHFQDLEDVREMSARGLIEPARLLEFFARIEPDLYKYPAIDPGSFRQAVEATVTELIGADGHGG